MARRNGVPSILKTSKILAEWILRYTPVIEQQFPSNSEVVSLLNDALACLNLLIQALEAIREYGD